MILESFWCVLGKNPGLSLEKGYYLESFFSDGIGTHPNPIESEVRLDSFLGSGDT